MTSAAADRSPSTASLPERRLRLGWLDALVAWRRPIYTLVVLLYLVSFNGIWRVGLDSALYRGLARSLARGDGYVFAGEKHHHAFAGVPWMLAGLEKIFGDSPVPGIVLIMLMALATLWLVDRLIALRYPLWVATLVTLGLAINFRFHRHSQELMTDVPFALGVMASLYGLERLRGMPWPERWAMARAAGLLLFGLALAAATRPTFGVLALAIVGGSLVRATRNTDGRRLLHVGLIAAAILVLVALYVTDPRTAGFSPMGGVYEQELVERVQILPRTLIGQLDRFLGESLNESFFSQHMAPARIPVALLLLWGAWLVLRRDIVWGLMVVGIVLVTLPLSTVPRYYIMVMPMLWLGWIFLVSKLGLRTPAAWRGPVVFVLLLFPLVMNFGRVCGFIWEQRRPDWMWLAHGRDRQETFFETYRGGVVPQQILTARMIAEHTRPGELTVGPAAHVLAYFSDRRVLGGRSLFGAKDVPASRLPAAIAKAKPDYAVFPAGQYGNYDSQLGDLIRKRVMLPDRLVATAGDATLNTVTFRLPPPGVNWKTYRPAEPTTRTTTAAGKRLSAKEKAELIAKRERKAERERREQLAAKRARIERQQKQIERERKLEQQAKKERQAKRERDLRKERKEQRERRERRERAVARAATRPAPLPPATLPATP